ncbi:MAG: hypothetical protein F6J93_23310 [Oscillatoria sp. SIO1A7]|nr:hypothetical protein [Oscillatoria sp. SIO1A7]
MGKLHTIYRPLSGAGKPYGNGGLWSRTSRYPDVKNVVKKLQNQDPS